MTGGTDKQSGKSAGLLKLLLLLSLLAPIVVQAEPSWQQQASASLALMVQKKPAILASLQSSVVDDYYQAHEYKLLWSDKKERFNRAYDLLRIIIDAEKEGLDPQDYYLKTIIKYWNSTDPEDTALLDLLLSAALYGYSNHVHTGRYKPQEMDADWHIRNEKLDSKHLFAEVSRKQSITELLKTLSPQQQGYRLLKEELQRFHELKHQGGWSPFAPGPVLEIGVQHSQVLQLRKRLELTGDLDECSVCAIDIFDGSLDAGVKRFQQRHGLLVDGRVGPQTRRALNISVDEKIRQIRANMERWRWMPRRFEKRYLLVNMTGFELYLMDDDKVVLSMPVIIGKAYRATPSFTGKVRVMEYNPYWTVPENMAIEDFVPRLIKDASYLSKKSIRLYRGWGENAREIDPESVDWRKLDKDRFPYWLQQAPGPKNSLGRIKFLFANPYDIYLHGTPDKHLFDRLVRTFSSGCIRVKDPVRLAAYLLNDGSQRMEEDILANIHLGSNQRVVLPAGVPIYLVYWTAWTDRDNKINFRPDIYGRNSKLIRVLSSEYDAVPDNL